MQQYLKVVVGRIYKDCGGGHWGDGKLSPTFALPYSTPARLRNGRSFSEKKNASMGVPSHIISCGRSIAT